MVHIFPSPSGVLLFQMIYTGERERWYSFRPLPGFSYFKFRQPDRLHKRIVDFPSPSGVLLFQILSPAPLAFSAFQGHFAGERMKRRFFRLVIRKTSGKPSVYAARGKIKISDEHVAYSNIPISGG